MHLRGTIIAGVRIGILAGLGLALAASATAPKPHEYSKAIDVNASYDAAWSAVVEVFADRNWAINNLEKASGLITTDWMKFDANEPFADCGDSGLSSTVGREVRFNVLVREQPAGATVTVNATFRELRSFDGREGYVDCNSTGSVEHLIHELVTERLSMRRPTPTPSAPAMPAETSPPATGAPAAESPPDGTLGGHCYGNQTCNADLRCDDIVGRCVSTQGHSPSSAMPVP